MKRLALILCTFALWAISFVASAETIAVIGTGIIGLELGQAFARLGVRVSLFSHSKRVGHFSDPAMQEVEVFCHPILLTDAAREKRALSQVVQYPLVDGLATKRDLP